jgi:hypothetical protein
VTYSSTILAEASLLSYWDLQEIAGSTSAADAKSALDLNVSSGTYTFGGAGPGGSLATSWVSNGTTGFLRRGVGTGTALDITGAISFDCWAKVNGTNTSDYGYFMSRQGASYAFATRSSGVLDGHANAADPDSTVSGVVSGSWAHYGYTVSAGGVWTFYVNGAQIGSTVASSAPVSSTNPITLGVWSVTPDFFVNANIAGCAIYNSQLSGASILAHYNALASGPVATRQVRGWITRSGGY